MAPTPPRAFLHLIGCLVILSSVIHLNNAAKSHFCDVKAEEQVELPCPDELDVMEQYGRPEGVPRLDFNFFRKIQISHSRDLMNELKKRSEKGQLCPHVKIVTKKACCPGFRGKVCDKNEDEDDEPSHGGHEGHGGHDEEYGHINQTHRLPFSTCLLWGKDHFRTFDGTFFQFPGDCTYKLAAASTWQVNSKFSKCDEFGTCQKTLQMYFGNKQITAQGRRVTVGTQVLDNDETYIQDSITIERRGEYTYLKFSDGVRLKWSADSLAVFLTIEEQYAKKVAGLCGDYNHENRRDFIMPDGSYGKDAFSFGNSWRTDSSCHEVVPKPHPCKNDAEMDEAERACRALDDPTDAFGTCRKVISSQVYIDNCKRDYCNARTAEQKKEAICHSFSAMAHECADHYLVVEWRRADRCPKQCPAGRIYTECASSCPKTCQNMHQNFTSFDCKKECVPDCVCPEGYYMDAGKNDTCVKSDDCTCNYRGVFYSKGTVSLHI